MKKIEAIIRKTKFEDVKQALLDADIEWFSYYDVRGEGKTRQADVNVERTVNAVMNAARTGEIGDGRIFIIPVDDSIRIRTGERGDIALYNAEQEK